MTRKNLLGFGKTAAKRGSGTRNGRDEPGRLELIGIDLAERRSRIRKRTLLPILATALIGALAVSALRVDLIRMRYGLADALAAEQSLLDEQRRLVVRMRQMRDPAGLAVRARELGFVAPERVIDLAPQIERVDPTPASPFSPATVLAAVGMTRP